MVKGLPFQKKKLHSAAVADADGGVLDCMTQEGCYRRGCFQVGGTVTTATVYFEGTIDGVTWALLEGVLLGVSATVASSVTAAGIWRFNCEGLTHVRARLDWTAGSIDVWGTLVA